MKPYKMIKDRPTVSPIVSKFSATDIKMEYCMNNNIFQLQYLKNIHNIEFKSVNEKAENCSY